MSTYLRFNNLREFSRYLDNCASSTKTVLARATADTSYNLLARTIPFTPIEFGPLRATGRVSLPIALGNTITAEITFGGAAAGYAIYVHERVVSAKTGRKIFHASPTKAKFLSETASDTFPAMQAEMFVRSLAIFQSKK